MVFRIPKEISELVDEGWIELTEAEDLKGPLLLAFPDEDDSVLIIGVSESSSTPKIDQIAKTFENLTASNVFVCQNLRTGVYSFKSAQGRYLSYNSLGQLQCSKEAVGPAEQWLITFNTASQACIKSSLYGKYMSLFEGKLRVDSEEEQPLKLYCQAARRKERLFQTFLASSAALQKSEDLSSFAQAQTKKYSGLKTNIRMDDLKEAAEEGTLREALLDKRIKAKHDPFC